MELREDMLSTYEGRESRLLSQGIIHVQRGRRAGPVPLRATPPFEWTHPFHWPNTRQTPAVRCYGCSPSPLHGVPGPLELNQLNMIGRCPSRGSLYHFEAAPLPL